VDPLGIVPAKSVICHLGAILLFASVLLIATPI
jgi:hypothetical protein